MKKFTLSLLLSILSLLVFSQEHSVMGKLQDTMNVKPVVFASVSLIGKSDSILKTFTRTNQKGEFKLNVTKPGKYILLVAHNTFVDYVDDIEIKEAEQEKNLGTIAMFQRGQLLREVFIKNSAAIKIKGDTLEFLADSFKVKEGAMVEDLLKVMPGIQVNKNGEITAMGEKVEKVLVDGEEFFGDDPTVATQNIQSKIVEKVQVFDKKSDQASFTGFDDGEEQKTINLKLKKDMNKGMFGKVELGGGWEDRWKNQAMINSFKNKRQISVYGLMSSNGETGLGWEDKNKYTGSGENNMAMDEDGGFMWTFNSDDDDVSFGRGGTEGITKAWTGGARYANKWNDGEHQANINYSFGRINKTKKESSLTQNLFPGSTYLTRDTSTSYSSRNTHRLTGKYTWELDSNTSIIYNLNTRLGFVESENFNATHNVSDNEIPISSSSRINSSNSKTTRVSNTLTLNRKLKKKGRTLSLNTSYTQSNNTGDGILDGWNQYSIGGTPLNEDLDQQKIQNQLTNNFKTDLTYTEPLSKKWILKASYGYANDVSQSDKSTLIKNLPTDDEYTTRIDSLSSDFDSKVQSHTVGAEVKFTEKKYNATIGIRTRYSFFDQVDKVRNLNYDYTRINLFPTLKFNYKFDQFSRFTFSYSGSTRQPSITQLQPIQDNSNPLQIYIGNPNLKIGFNQSFNINFFNYKVLSSRSIYSGIYFSNSFNNIALNRSFDQLGRTINQYVNLNGGYDASLWGGFQTKVPKTDLQVGFNLNGNLAHTPNIFNNIKGITNSYSITMSPSIMYNKEEKIFLDIKIGGMYSNSKNSLKQNSTIQYFSFVPTASVTYYLPLNFELNAEADYQYTPPVAPYPNSFSRLLLNGGLSYRMLKEKNLTWNITVDDILNQNRGYERNTTDNFNTERQFMTLGRYWMVGLVWTFTTGPMSETKRGAGGPPRMPKGRRGGMRGRMR